MSPGLIGLFLGVTSFALLMWIAGRMERERPGPEGASIARMLRIVAYADLILIPLFMHVFSAPTGR